MDFKFYIRFNIIYNLEIFTNGELDISLPRTNNMYNDGNLLFGTHALEPQNSYKGILDDIRIYNYALTESEIQDLYNDDEFIPVELHSFSCTAIGKSILIKWNTATEKNNQGFILEKFIDDNWEELQFIAGYGNSTVQHEYQYIDHYEFISFKGEVKYRLKQIDFDGSINYSDVISIDVDFTPKEFALYQNYPNPFNPITTIKYSIPNEGAKRTFHVHIVVFDVIGNEVSTLVNENKPPGNYKVEFDAFNLPSGIYFYRLQSADYISTRKMLLLK